MECKKIKYKKKEEALSVLDTIQELDKDKNKKLPLRVYKCNFCSSYHLTSWSKKKKTFVKRIIDSRFYSRIEKIAEYWIKKKNWKEII